MRTMSSVTAAASGAPIRTYHANPSQPRLKLPAGACDSHVHVFGPGDRYPYAPTRNFTPVDAPRETLFALHHTLGISRCVIVQSMVHGLDNRVVEDAIAAGGGRYLGVALVRADVPDAELARLAAAGFRGVRFNFSRHLGPGAAMDDVVALTHRLAPLGLHLQVHFDADLIHELAGPLRRSAVPVVIDHMARVDARLGAQHANFRRLLDLLQDARFRVKISGIDRVDAGPGGAPDYAAGIALAALLLRLFPQQCLWGTDWPHPNHTHIPDDARLVEALAEIAPTEAQRQQLLVDNPQTFYQFAP